MPGFLTSILGGLGIKGILALGLAAALGITMWRADAISNQRDKARDALSMEQAKHAITRQSLQTLEKTLADYIQKGREREEAAQKALEKQKAVSRSLDRQIERIRAEAAPEDCETSEAVMEAEGL